MVSHVVWEQRDDRAGQPRFAFWLRRDLDVELAVAGRGALELPSAAVQPDVEMGEQLLFSRRELAPK